MKTLREKIYDAINRERSNNPGSKFDGYEDDYDGFTHLNYAGLVDDIIWAMSEEGYENPSQKIIDEFVFQMI